jgi:hypothetical protein
MAYLEMSLVLAKTLWYFDFVKAPGEAENLGGGEGVVPRRAKDLAWTSFNCTML